jgi:hypothetical protein
MKINRRWIIQALAFIGCIYFFVQIWESSKQWLAGTTSVNLFILILQVFLFAVCFLVMAVTSYLKQRNNGTLKNAIPLFERLLAKIGLT